MRVDRGLLMGFHPRAAPAGQQRCHSHPTPAQVACWPPAGDENLTSAFIGARIAHMAGCFFPAGHERSSCCLRFEHGGPPLDYSSYGKEHSWFASSSLPPCSVHWGTNRAHGGLLLRCGARALLRLSAVRAWGPAVGLLFLRERALLVRLLFSASVQHSLGHESRTWRAAAASSLRGTSAPHVVCGSDMGARRCMDYSSYGKEH
jgi:hypothetical protein